MVGVHLPRRGKARVEVRRCRADRNDLNRAVQSVPEGRAKFVGAVGPRRVKVEDLPGRMGAGVGPPACVDAGVEAKHAGEARFQDVLNRRSARLALPPGELGPVVGANALPALHGSRAGPTPPGAIPSR
jgi:hypothetical protein